MLSDFSIFISTFSLQDHIKFLLCDYRQLPKTEKYDRIISWLALLVLCKLDMICQVFSIFSYLFSYRRFLVICSEMLEAVGHEYMEDFFRCCESALAEDGIFVLQVSGAISKFFNASKHLHSSYINIFNFFFFISSYRYRMRGISSTRVAQSSSKSIYSPVDACRHSAE